jgi:hypothetical protein
MAVPCSLTLACVQCRDVSRAAFETAKHNLEHNFLVVGVTERFTESVRVLDEVLPVS